MGQAPAGVSRQATPLGLRQMTKANSPDSIDDSSSAQAAGNGAISNPDVGGMSGSPSTTRSASNRSRSRQSNSPVAGRAGGAGPRSRQHPLEKPVLPHLADAAGIVLGARVPVIVTSRADSVMTRLASCAVAVLVAEARRASGTKAVS